MTKRVRAGRLADISLLLPIAGSHIRRLGWGRTLFGGLPMYLGIPVLVGLHLAVGLLLFRCLLRPVLGLSPVRWSDHLVIDRHRIEALSPIDKFNCVFCGYANGLSTLINVELDHLARTDGARLGWARRLWLTGCLILTGPMILVGELHFQVIYNLFVSRLLGMRRVTLREAQRALGASGYGAGLPKIAGALVRACKNCMVRFAMALEQIESAWCPLRHFEEREGIVYPDHHRHFFGPDQVEAMREVLLTVGTVAPREDSGVRLVF